MSAKATQDMIAGPLIKERLAGAVAVFKISRDAAATSLGQPGASPVMAIGGWRQHTGAPRAPAYHHTSLST